jgi:hypothetical protein
MRIAVLTLFTCMSIFSTFAQKITILKTLHPYYNILEWKGMGGILMSKDANGNSNQIYLTLVGEKEKSLWDQQIAPPDGKYYYVSSENARYVYFLRNLNPENGKVYFDQLNSAGNVKNTSVSLVSAIKNLGYDAFSLELRNVVVTDKALVHHFRYFDKKEKIYTDIATFITHHNMLVYAVELGKVKDDEVKAGRSNHFQYVGFSGDEICFADYTTANTGKGWSAVVFNSKGQEQRRVFLKNKATGHSSISTAGFGTNGAYYLNTEKDQQNGLVTFHNGKFYFTVLNNSTGKPVLELYQLENEEWKKINNHTILNTASKKTFSIGLYPLNEALTYRISGGENGDQTVALFLDGSTPIVNNYTESVIFNPSRMIISDKKEFFAVTLPTGNLFFDKNQLKTAKDVEFEFIKK